ncbi:hypothetical protein [Acuticoccus sp. I52.16.1]|uniref:hypothetical protein n=1 Tax=Acuticoccus sp. I52.16.1 TaxID=2928472 RepID=UPI001FD45534|nr:hypothetical protein [Acuticoccus sp. I52.16.1]UOM37299.1 hypothetical protein MRB58_24650 [Acuticoccus sp. I52.16.1]
MSFPFSVRLAAVCLALSAFAPALIAPRPALAQDTQVTATSSDATSTDAASSDAVPSEAARPALALALNSLAPSGEACRLSFVVRNDMGAEIEDLGLELAVFGSDGGLSQLLRFSFGMLLEGKTRVKQFDLAETPCEEIGRVLVNDVVRCEGGELTALACLRALSARSDADIAFGL